MFSLFLIPLFSFSCGDESMEADAYGTFEAIEITISAEANGKLLDFAVEEGIQLGIDEKVGEIDKTELLLKREQLLAQKEAVAAKLVNINAQIQVQMQQKQNLIVDQNRMTKLVKIGAISEKQYDDVIGNIQVIKKQIDSTLTQNQAIENEVLGLEKQIAQLDESINKCNIINPVKGTVLAKYTEIKEIATVGKPLYKIADVNIMKLRVYVSGSQLPHIKLNQDVTVFIDKDEDDKRQLNGKISWISDSAEFTPKIIQTKEERVNLVYAVKIDVPNDGSLKIGMPGEAKFTSN